MNATTAANDRARGDAADVGKHLRMMVCEIGVPGSVASALAIAHECLRHVESILGSRAALVGALMFAGEFRKKLSGVAHLEEGSPVPFALAQVEVTPDGFTIGCRSSAGVDDHSFPDVESAAETALLLKFLGWRLRFGAGAEVVRDLVATAIAGSRP